MKERDMVSKIELSMCFRFMYFFSKINLCIMYVFWICLLSVHLFIKILCIDDPTTKNIYECIEVD